MITKEQLFAMQSRLDRNKTPEIVLPKREKDIHAEIMEWCASQGYYFVHSRTDKRTTTAVGLPDFIIATFEDVWFIEVKRKGSKPTIEQLAHGTFLKKLNKKHAIVYSLKELQEFMRWHPDSELPTLEQVQAMWKK